MTVQRGFDLVQSAGCERLAILRDNNDVCSVAAEFFSELRLNIHVQGHHRRCHRGGDHDGEQRRGSAPTAHQGSSHQHPYKHRRPSAPALNAHASPRSTYTGSNCMALRIDIALPANVTNTAMLRMMGKSTGWIVICELKMLWPICRASTLPHRNPTTPPRIASSAASVKNREATDALPAPSAFIRPTSPRRSRIAVAIAADTAKAEANKAARVTSSISPLMRDSTVPSFCATCRICSARECGIASCN